ncbi:hypothetical protein ABOONEI_2115 [Aciduliprofundum boonei T469]|nr:hypothetical protein ABOONEI_2115 [Aciduliprofundum boonei T469]
MAVEDENLKYAAVPENLGRKIAFGTIKIEDILKFVMYLGVFSGLSMLVHAMYLLIFFLPLAAIMAFKKFDGLEFWQYLKLRMKNEIPSLPLSLYFGEVLFNGKYYFSVLEVNGISYAFMSDEDRIGLLLKYESMLNSCDFPLQFVVHTERLNYQPFLDTVVNDTPTANDYKDLIREACEGLYIQRYFIVVGVNAFEITGKKEVKAKIAWDKIRERIDILSVGLTNMGIGYRVLKGQELINIYKEVM